MQKQAAESCAAVAAQTAAVKGQFGVNDIHEYSQMVQFISIILHVVCTVHLCIALPLVITGH